VKSDLVGITARVVAASPLLMFFNEVWPGSGAGSPRMSLMVFAGPFLLVRPATRRSQISLKFAVYLVVALAVLAIADRISPISAQPGWAYAVTSALAAWTGGVAVVVVFHLWARPGQAREAADHEPAGPGEAR
jgi:hypothetical protein